MNTQEWIASLKVGDEVGLSRHGYVSIERISEVCNDKRKKAKIRVGGLWFDSNGNRTPPERWSSMRIVTVTEKHREELKRDRLLAHIRDAPFATYATERLERLAAIVDEGVKP